MMGALDAQHDHDDRAAHHRAQHQGPVAQSQQRADERREAPHERLAGIDPGEAPELEIAGQKGARYHLYRADNEREAERDDDPSDHRFTKEPGDRARQAERRGEQSDSRQQRQPAELSDLPARQVAVLHDRRAQPQLVHELHEACIDHRHGEQAIVGGRDQAGDDQRRRPADELGDPLDASGPREARDEGAVEILGSVSVGHIVDR